MTRLIHVSYLLWMLLWRIEVRGLLEFPTNDADIWNTKNKLGTQSFFSEEFPDQFITSMEASVVLVLVRGNDNGVRAVIILIGAPRAESEQVGTERAGALYSCPINAVYKGEGDSWCSRVKSEYQDENNYNVEPGAPRDPMSVSVKGKNGQLFGASVASEGKIGGYAVVCAPLIRFERPSYTQGVCYKMNSALEMSSDIRTCQQKLSGMRSGRHNEYGGCMEGISVTMGGNNTMATGVIGAVRWTGGVRAEYKEPGTFGNETSTNFFFGNEVLKYTMGFEHEELNVRAYLQGHDYLGYSVAIGNFGFKHETSKHGLFTVASGATRSGQNGAVLFFPFDDVKTGDHSNALLMTEDRFVLNGTRLGSAFGYATMAVDINNDGFDDLVVGAPFEHRSDKEGQFGGIAYVYFASGKQASNKEVFLAPVVLKGAGYYSQFGQAITKLGNMDQDPNGFNDFAVGAPFANDGYGAVYIYLGAKNRKEFRRKPAQVILGSELPNPYGPVKSFGFSLSGGVDLDGNGYPDLVVGAVSAGTTVILRARPVIDIASSHTTEPSGAIPIEKSTNCPRGAKTCFYLDLSLWIEKSQKPALLSTDSDVFMCNLEVISAGVGESPRAFIVDSHSGNYSWPCGREAANRKIRYKRQIYLPTSDLHAKDWINPLRFRFTVRIRNDRPPPKQREGSSLVELSNYPVLNKYGASYSFNVSFNTGCGRDDRCETDLSLKAVFVDIPSTDQGHYVTNVGDKEHLDLSFQVENRGEKAYSAALYLNYDSEELELPEISDNKVLKMDTLNKHSAVVYLGNPMDTKKKFTFNVRFKLVRGRTEGIGRPLEFNATLNSTSNEMKPNDNTWSASVKLIKKVELELVGSSDPMVIHYGGVPQGESSISLEEDIGLMIRHNYTVYNSGNWTIRNVTAKFEWPWQVASSHIQGPWALYLLDPPTITTYNTDGSYHVRTCTVDKSLYVNPIDIALNTMYSQQETPSKDRDIYGRRLKRQVGEIHSTPEGKERVAPRKKLENGYEVDVVTIAAPMIDFRARLWNSTFVEDYNDVEYVELESRGWLELDPTQGIEDDPKNNAAAVVTTAYPDRPAIGDSRPIPWWVIAGAVLVGILILLLIVLCLWKCGFFKRKTVEPLLHRAQLNHEREQWSVSR